MKRIFLVMAALVLSANAAFAGTTTQKWTAGYTDFNEPLNYKNSNVKWSVNPTTNKLTVTYTLVGAKPSKLYQVGLDIFCTTFATTFGQFPVDEVVDGNCTQFTEQGVTETEVYVANGVVTTDIHGNGAFTVVVGPVTSRSYSLEFVALDGAGCDLTGGGGRATCVPTFQSPGPKYGDATTITIP